MFFFFFSSRRRHTRSDRDWSSDVCSSDLNRPELASQQALVQATLVRLRQERLRPLIPLVVLGGDAAPAAPGGYLTGGVFNSNLNGVGSPWAGRNDVNVQVLWELRNLGFGNSA